MQFQSFSLLTVVDQPCYGRKTRVKGVINRPLVSENKVDLTLISGKPASIESAASLLRD